MAPPKKTAPKRKARTKADKPTAPTAATAKAPGAKRAKAPRAEKAAAAPKAKRPSKAAALTPSTAVETAPASEFAKEYSDESFWAKVKNHGKTAGRAVLDPAARLYYAGIDPATPLWARTTIIGALGYFIAPFDAIPDMTPMVGYADDLGVLTLAVGVVAAHITPEHKKKARDKLNEWFGKEATASAAPLKAACDPSTAA